ncbi:DUF1992 domain-containing protein [Xylanimonas oleitrophica]|uniref:DUF1992 domain-containing protein n=1 Tax=Xylanimonas oleitrophica TaxID=2607479 RepID=A0A2W5WP70_9MICO|nr:DUF1992 domain-containing protein [Xylanimonas oleitrophica]PZR53187.1 DUF1992 domain-containing protein [Xylanimonas oleitrophica]
MGEPEDDPVRRAAQYRVDREADRERSEQGLPAPAPREDDDEEPPRPRYTPVPGDRQRFIDTVIDQAVRRGEFDDLPLAGKPIPGISGTHDPDWWLKSLVEREQITGVLPSAQLRAESRAMHATLDREPTEARVREILEEFNARMVDARRQLRGGPPVVTPTRDVEAEVAAWRERRAAAGLPVPGGAPGAGAASRSDGGAAAPEARSRRRWWRRA